jgi:hyaluronan synthase
LLTRLIAMRYWIAFNQERAAQSLFGVVLCCSGPFSAYRTSVIDEVKRDYAAQSFLGARCTFGDDRHLTNLVLARGYTTRLCPRAEALTHVPDTVADLLRQQVRWNKSFYRELLWTVRFAHRRHPYLALDLVLQTALPLMLLGALLTVGLRAVSSPGVIGTYALVVLGVALLRSAYGAVRTRSPQFLLFAAYGFVHVLLLLPARIYALCTIGRTHWGTRGMTSTSTAGTADLRIDVLQPIVLPSQRRSSTEMATADSGCRSPADAGQIADILPALHRSRLGRHRAVDLAGPPWTLPRQRTASVVTSS